MLSKLSLLSLLCVCLSNLPQITWTRTVSVSLNMSLTRSVEPDRNSATASPKLSQDMLQSCMRETELSMSQLKLFRLGLLFNDNSNDENELIQANANTDGDFSNSNNLKDMDSVSQPYLDTKRNEPLQCFTRCLYQRLGLIHYDMMLEEAFKLQLEGLMQRLKPELKECKNMDSKNRCEAAYKLHVCYNHLKNLEAEQRLREILERSETDNDLAEPAEDENENEINGIEKEKELLEGIQPYEEPAATKE